MDSFILDAMISPSFITEDDNNIEFCIFWKDDIPDHAIHVTIGNKSMVWNLKER